MTTTHQIASQLSRQEKTDFFEVLPAELLTTADRTSQEFGHPTAVGLMLKVMLANEAGAVSLTINLQMKDADGAWVTFYTSAALTANGTTLIYIHPNGGTNSLWTIVPFSIPRTWRLFLDYSGTPANDKIDTEVHAAFLL